MILHLDADCFFASCEMMREPSLKTKPLVVGGSGHTICIAKNYIAKSFGIETGMPLWEAKVKCPNLVFRPVDFSLYGKVSKKMFAIADQWSNTMEITSIDECFLDLKIHESKRGKQTPPSCQGGGMGGRSESRQFYETFANALRSTVENQLGITISVGIAETKTLAKIASENNKPNGVTIVMPSDRELFLKSVPINAVPGIGHRQTPKMLIRGLKTPYDYTQVDLPTIRTLFHRPGINHWWELQGVQMLPVTSESKLPQSIIRTRSFESPTTDRSKIWSSYVEHTQRLLVALQQNNLAARRIFLHLRLRDFSAYNFEVQLENHTSFYSTLIAAVKKLYRQHVHGQLVASQAFRSERSDVGAKGAKDKRHKDLVEVRGGDKSLYLLSEDPIELEVRSTGVGATDLRPLENYQYSLFEGVNERPLRLESAILQVNKKWGQGTIIRGIAK